MKIGITNKNEIKYINPSTDLHTGRPTMIYSKYIACSG
jgi:hypothetical protein